MAGNSFVDRRAFSTRKWALKKDQEFLATLIYGFRFAEGVPEDAAQKQMRNLGMDPARFEFALDPATNQGCAFVRHVHMFLRGPMLHLQRVEEVPNPHWPGELNAIAMYQADEAYHGAVRERRIEIGDLRPWPPTPHDLAFNLTTVRYNRT